MSNPSEVKIASGWAAIVGGCPHCGMCENVENIGAEEWAVCYAHKTKWHAGTNSLSENWRKQTEEERAQVSQRLNGFAEVKPPNPVRPALAIMRHQFAPPHDFCSLCGKQFSIRSPLENFLANSADPVCRNCAEMCDPIMSAMLDNYYRATAGSDKSTRSLE